MSIELLKKDLSKLKGKIGDFFKMGIPNLDNIVDFSEDQLYNIGDTVCIYDNVSKEYQFYKCGKNNSVGKIDNVNWELHMVYSGSGGKGQSGGVTEKKVYILTTDIDNTREIRIPMLEFNAEIHKIDMFVNGILYSPNKYAIVGKTITINPDQVGLSKEREITLNIYTII